MSNRLISAVRRLPDSVKRALRTAIFTFAGTFGIALAGFLNNVQSWAATGGQFPSVAVLGKAAVSGIVGASAGLVTWAWNALEDRGFVPSLFAATKPDARFPP